MQTHALSLSVCDIIMVTQRPFCPSLYSSLWIVFLRAKVSAEGMLHGKKWQYVCAYGNEVSNKGKDSDQIVSYLSDQLSIVLIKKWS